MAACAPHDQVQAPSCANADGSVRADAPSWCASNWCFVDRDNCDGVAEAAPSSYFHVDGQEATFYYSYETCSHDNSFTDSADDDQACNAEHSDTASWCAPTMCEQVDTNDDNIVGVDDLLLLLSMYGDHCSDAGR